MRLADYLIDNSALVRVLSDADLQEKWRPHLSAGLVATCQVTDLEFMYSARSRSDRAEKERLLERLFLPVPMPDAVYQRAWEVQSELTDRGEHRSAGTVDLLVAATAELSGLTLLHVDRDFACVASVTGQPTQWLKKPD